MTDDEFYDRIIEVIDAVKLDERPRDTDEYASDIYEAAKEWRN